MKKKLFAFVLATVLSIGVIGNMNMVAFGETDESVEIAKNADSLIVSEDQNIVGYSDARVEYVDLTQVAEFDSTQTYSAGDFFKIASAEQLQAFSEKVNDTDNENTFADVTAYLASDIDMANVTFTPIGYDGKGTQGKIFAGIFDGQGYEVSNITISAASNTLGFFGNVKGADIKNLIVSGSITVTGDSAKNQCGGIVGYVVKDGNTTIDNCYSKMEVTNSTTGGYIGGIVGMVQSGGSNTDNHIIKNCTSAGDVSGAKNVGGIVGGALYTLEVSNCRNVGTVKATGSSSTVSAQ